MDHVGGWAIACLGLAVPLSIAVTQILWIPLAVFWGVGGLLRRPWARWRVIPLGWPSLGVGLETCLNGAVGGMLLRGLQRVRSDLNWLACFVVASVPANREVALRGFRWFLLGSCIAATLGLVQCGIGIVRVDSGAFEQVPAAVQAWPASLLEYIATVHRRAVGTRSHPLTYAAGLLFAWALFLALWLWRRGWQRVWAGLGVLVVGAALVWSKSRGPWFAGLVIVGLAWTMGRRRFPWWGPTAFLVVMGAVMVHPQILARIKTIGDFQEGSHVIRWNLWQVGWRMWRDHPWTGVGPDNVSRLSPRYQPSGGGGGEGWGDVHNLYLQVLVERGVIGFGVFLWFLATLLRYLAKLYGGYRGDPEHAPWFLGAFLGAVSCLLAGVTETTLKDTEILLTLAFIVGSAMALHRCLAHEAESG